MSYSASAASAASMAATGFVRADMATRPILGTLDIPSRRKLVDLIASATERRLLPWESVKKLARLAASRGVVFASRAWLAEFLGVSVRTVARLLDDLRRAKVFAILAARGIGGGTVMVPVFGQEIDESELARALLREIGEPEEAPCRAGTFKALAVSLRRMVGQLPEGTIAILRRVAQRASKMCHARLIESHHPSESLTLSSSRVAESEQEPAPAPAGRGLQKDAQGRRAAASVSVMQRLAGWLRRSPPEERPASVFAQEAHRQMTDPDALRASAARLGLLKRP